MKHSILCVDDEKDNVEALERLFRRKYKVFTATSGAEGLEIIKDQHISLIMSDQRMPEMTGVEFLKKSIKIYPDSIRILLTGYTDIDSVVGAINSGQVYRYLNKPWDPVDLTNTVDKAIERYDLSFELKRKNTELAAALNELKTLDDSKNHFMVLVNHELKTPLTVIMSFLELLKESHLNKEQQMYINKIEQSSGRLKNIVDDVLQLVSAETHIIKVNKKKLNLNQLLNEIVASQSDKAKKNNKDLTLVAEDIKIKVDPQIFSTITNRLIDNAIKFSDKNSPIVIEVLVTENDETRISVTNKGRGPSSKAIQKMLKPFTLDENIINHSQGMGLGLSLAQALLKTHNSELHMECLRGKVVVSFTLPNT